MSKTLLYYIRNVVLYSVMAGFYSISAADVPLEIEYPENSLGGLPRELKYEILMHVSRTENFKYLKDISLVNQEFKSIADNLPFGLRPISFASERHLSRFTNARALRLDLTHSCPDICVTDDMLQRFSKLQELLVIGVPN